MFELECNRNLFNSLAAAVEQRTEKSLEALMIELHAWKHANKATMDMIRTPKSSFGKQQTQSPTADIFCAMGDAADGNWSDLEKIYDDWCDNLAERFSNPERDWRNLDELGNELPL